MRARTRAGGFTLVEVIVAFALLALGLALILGALTRATGQVRWSADAGRAALHAQSLLDQAGVGEALAPGTREGELEDGRYRWRMEVAEWADPDLPPAAARPLDPVAPRLLELHLQVAWGEGADERVSLRSLRFVQPDPTAPVRLP
ncbi:prepilin-type N-terminal cleavage/methylation domain-containing protein [Luteimonas pelagia]